MTDKEERILERVRSIALRMAPFLGLGDWQFRFEIGTSEPNRGAEVLEDYWNHRATIYWNMEQRGYTDSDFFHIKVLHELLHCAVGWPAAIVRSSLEDTPADDLIWAQYSMANEETVSSLARHLWFNLIKPLWGKPCGRFPQEWGQRNWGQDCTGSKRCNGGKIKAPAGGIASGEFGTGDSRGNPSLGGAGEEGKKEMTEVS